MENILLGFQQILQPATLFALFIGVSLGLTVGAIPGLNDSITMAILIPISFGFEPAVAVMLLVGIYTSACYGGSIPAILLNIPGTASSLVTTIDGYAMTKKGEAGQALGISTMSSVFGGVMSSLILIFLSPVLARWALNFGPPEYFALAILGISTVVGMAGVSITKNLIATFIGLLIGIIGMDPQTGFPRLIFGNPYLLEGISFVPLLIGLFGVTSMFEIAEKIYKEKGSKPALPKIGRILPDLKMAKRLLPTWIISGGIGNIIGVIPGAGMIMAVYFAYDQTKRRLKDKVFGTGIPEGVAAPEAANNAVVASSMVPLLSLGIPGNSTSALFLGALMIQGLRPGPSLFRDSPEIAYLIIIGFLVANVFFMWPMGLLVCKSLATALMKIPQQVLVGIVMALCVSGAFAVNNSIFDIWIMLAFGIVIYLFNKLNLPSSAFILAFILGPIMERNLYQSLTLSQNNLAIFVTRPLSLVMLIMAFFFFITPFIKKQKNKFGNQS